MLKVFCNINSFYIILLTVSVFLGSTFSITEAARRTAPVNTVNYFNSQEVEIDGRKALRLEIGMTKAGVDYEVSTREYIQKQLILDLNNVKLADLAAKYSLNSKVAKSISFKSIEPKKAQIKIDLADTAKKENYNIHFENAERHAKKPYRLVIDIFADDLAEANAIEGVSGATIVLDAGHGGSDSGAIGPSGVTEKEVTLAVTQKLRDILTKSGANVVMTRDTDVDVYAPNASDRQELQARCNVANRLPSANLFLSIHCNAFANSAAHGMETYYYEPSSSGRRLATLLNEELAAAGGLFNRGVKTANFYVLKHTNMPASLIELGFITNYNEERLLAGSDYQTKLAYAIATALTRYFSR